MITELRNQYENNVAKLKGDIKGFIQNNKPNKPNKPNRPSKPNTKPKNKKR